METIIQAPTVVSPELIVYNTINVGLKFIRDDYKTKLEENRVDKSWLYLLLNSRGLQKYNWFSQAVSVLCNKPTDPRYLTVDITYNVKQEKQLSCFMNLSQDSSGQDTISNGESNDIIEIDENSFLKVFERRFNGSISFYIYSDNSNETFMLYHIFRSIFIALNRNMEILGIRNVKYSGADIAQYPDFIPKNMFYRNLTLSFNYLSSVPEMKINKYVKELMFMGEPIEN